MLVAVSGVDDSGWRWRGAGRPDLGIDGSGRASSYTWLSLLHLDGSDGGTWRCSWASHAAWGSLGQLPGHGGGGLLLHQSWSANWLWRISGSHIKYRRQVGEAWLPVKTVLRLRSWQAMTPSKRRYLVEGIAIAYTFFPLALFQGKPQIRVFWIG